jgi:hypothetical protein
MTRSLAAFLLVVSAQLIGCPAERAAFAPNDPHINVGSVFRNGHLPIT